MATLIKEWKNIVGYEKLYQVSNYGEVRAKRRVIYDMIDGERQPISVAKEHSMALIDNGNGYLYVTLLDENGHSKNHYIHRLVAQAFMPNPDNLPQVNHLDYDRKNNKVTNLEWCTSKDNTRYSLCNQPKTHDYVKSSIGYKYISKRGEKYRVTICLENRTKTLDKTFKTLEEAINYRNIALKEMGIECKDNFN